MTNPQNGKNQSVAKIKCELPSGSKTEPDRRSVKIDVWLPVGVGYSYM